MLVPISSGVNNAGSCLKTLCICVGAHKFRKEPCRELLKDLKHLGVGVHKFRSEPCRELLKDVKHLCWCLGTMQEVVRGGGGGLDLKPQKFEHIFELS